MNWPRLETNRLWLRGVVPGDRLAIFKNYSDPEVAQWFFHQPYTQIKQADQVIREFIEKSEADKGFTWAILLKETGEFIGTCGYEEVEVGLRGEIGFDLAKEQWGQGYMAEALRAIIDYGFQALKLATVEAHTYSRNSRARRLLEKLGFRVEAVTQDSHSYTLSKTDWMTAGP